MRLGFVTHIFDRMTEPELRAWLEADPHCVNAQNPFGETCLFRAVNELNNASLVLWLVERGAEGMPPTMLGTPRFNMRIQRSCLTRFLTLRGPHHSE